MKQVCSGGAVRDGWYRLMIAPIILMLMVVFTPRLTGLADATALAAADLSTISGQVTHDGTAVDDAVVVAARSSLARSVPTAADGSYSLDALPAGEYTLSVRPAAVTTTSPNWVATAAPVLVEVPPDGTHDFTVETASVTVSGTLVAPSGYTFDAPNRAWMRAENQEGQGNSVQVASDGTFSIKALPGIVLLDLVLENQEWAAPLTLKSRVYHAEAGETIDVGRLEVVVKQARISGSVRVLEGGNAPAGIPVRAWRLDGAEFEQTRTDDQGSYVLHVFEGVWLVHPMPLEEQPYVSATKPERVVVDAVDATVTRDLSIAAADVSLRGMTVDSATGEPLTEDVFGRAYALYPQDDRSYPDAGPSARVEQGEFTLKLSSSVSGVYSIGVAFPPDVPYTAVSRVQVNLSSAQVEPIRIPITAGNAHIRGELVDRNAQTVTDVPGSVWAASDNGGWARTRVNPVDGGYDLPVTTTDVNGSGGSTWRVGAFVDPTSGYYVQRPRRQHVFLPFNNGAGSTQDGVDFTLVKTETMGQISGTVTAPGDRTLRGVRVMVHEVTGDHTTAVVRWTYTNKDGRYDVRVPAGTYRVSAGYGHELRQHFNASQRWINPAPVMVVLPEQGNVAADLRFRVSDATVTGQVTYNGAGHPALVRARSADGANVFAHAGADGTFELHLLSGQNWTLKAVSSEGSDFLHSSVQEVTPARGNSSLSDPLVLMQAGTIPDSQAFVFQADEDHLFTMSDTSQVQVPSGTLAVSGTVALTVNPLPELVADENLQPVSFGYRLHAYDLNANGVKQPITRFARPVTLMIPFTAAQLDALGIGIDQLVPAYWDTASASWKPVENVSVIPDSQGGGTVNVSVDHFTDFALMANPSSSVFLPSVLR